MSRAELRLSSVRLVDEALGRGRAAGQRWEQGLTRTASRESLRLPSSPGGEQGTEASTGACMWPYRSAVPSSQLKDVEGGRSRTPGKFPSPCGAAPQPALVSGRSLRVGLGARPNRVLTSLAATAMLLTSPSPMTNTIGPRVG